MQEGDNHLEQKIDIHNLGNMKCKKQWCWCVMNSPQINENCSHLWAASDKLPRCEVLGTNLMFQKHMSIPMSNDFQHF